MQPFFHPARRQRGMSLVDILVGMVIGLIGMIVVFQSFQAFEGQKRTTTTNNDAQESGLMGLTVIEREMRLAGYGMFYNSQPICNGLKQYTSTTGVTTQTNFLPVVITNGASNGPDIVTLVFSSSTFAATPSQVQVTFNGNVPEVIVDNTISNRVYNIGDIVLVGKNGQACARLQVSGIRQDAENPRVLGLKVERTSQAPLNPPATSLKDMLPATGFTNERVSLPSVVANMGQMRRVAYSVSVDINHKGRLMSQDLTAGTDAVSIADGIMDMQAQYGISTTASEKPITSWVNASGAWATPSFSEQGRIKAVRIAVVARSQLLEKEEVQGVDVTCKNTSGDNTKGPCTWKDTTASPAPIVDLTANSNWKRYRYRVYETIVPLRNVMWQY